VFVGQELYQLGQQISAWGSQLRVRYASPGAGQQPALFKQNLKL
jgi:hypothetical protein